MSKMIQIRHVPDAVHRRLKSRAALDGRSLSDFLLQELQRIAEHPTRAELMARLAKVTRKDLSPSPAALIRADRDAR